MSKQQKLISRILEKPKDFTWSELQHLLASLDYIELQGRGSRVKFYNKTLDSLIQLHKPHRTDSLQQAINPAATGLIVLHNNVQ